jgi:hypothetical protein
MTHFLSNASNPLGFYDADGESPEPGDIFRAVAGSNPAAVFMIIPINDVMAGIFDTPVPSVYIEELLRVGLLGGSACDAVSGFTGFFTGLFFDAVSLDDKCLCHVGEVDIIVEFGSGPYFSGFDPSMFRWCEIGEIRFLAVLEIELDVLKKCGLVVFNGEVIVSLTLPDYVVGDITLS